MSSPPPQVIAWQGRWPRDITQIAPNLNVARAKLVLAQNHLANAVQLLAGKQNDLSLMSAELALVACADLILARDGWTVRSHAVRFAYPLLTQAFTANAGLVYAIRTARNAAQYDAPGRVPAKLANQAVALAKQALGEVAALIP